MARLLVTGATGFVGRATIRRLARDGHWLRIVRRRPGPPPAGVGEQVALDLAAPADWRAALAGMEGVVHLAGLAHGRAAAADAAAFQEVNVTATDSLGQAAAEAGIRRFVYVSSIKAMAERSPGRALTEADAPRPEDAYGRSKLAAEERLMALADRLDIVCLRPPLVYGPGVGANFRALMTAVARGLPLPFAAVRNRRSLIALDNLADAIATAVTASGGSGRYLVCGQPALSTADLVRALGDALQRPARLVAVPAVMLRALGVLPVLGPRIGRLIGDLEVDDTLFRSRFGWIPPVTAADALGATADWYRRQSA